MQRSASADYADFTDFEVEQTEVAELFVRLLLGGSQSGDWAYRAGCP